MALSHVKTFMRVMVWSIHHLFEAARYDNYAQYNPHYRCKMYKMHIFHLNEFPLFEIFSQGNDHDAPFAIPLAGKRDPNESKYEYITT